MPSPEITVVLQTFKKMFKRARHRLSSHFTPLSPPNPDHSFIKERLEEMDVSRCLTVLILDSSFDEKMILHAAYLTVILLLIILVIILSVILWKRRSRPGTLSIDNEQERMPLLL